MNRSIIASLALAAALSAAAQTQKVSVLELHQAPGQFVNQLPGADEETTQEEVCEAAEETLEADGLITLGTYGGYITVKFDHPVENKPGSDFCVWGNGFYAAADPVYGSATIGGSIEPGIVYVGVGDDVSTAKWYELAGSEYYTTEVHDFSITYYKPTTEKTVSEYVRWRCSWTGADGTRRDSTGWHAKNGYHKQTYWPQYEGKDSLTFAGGKLPNNAIDQSGVGTYYVQYRYAADAYGYVDACPAADTTYSSFDISWAVDAEGNPVELERVDFIRVACGIFQMCGWLGETSTEVAGFTDLHLLPGYDDNPIRITPRERPTGMAPVRYARASDDAYYNLQGMRVPKPVKGHVYIHGGKKAIYK